MESIETSLPEPSIRAGELILGDKQSEASTHYGAYDFSGGYPTQKLPETPNSATGDQNRKKVGPIAVPVQVADTVRTNNPYEHEGVVVKRQKSVQSYNYSIRNSDSSRYPVDLDGRTRYALSQEKLIAGPPTRIY